MNKEQFEDTELETVYKNVFVCKKCGQKYGHDSTPKQEICPFCERAIFKPGRPSGQRKIRAAC